MSRRARSSSVSRVHLVTALALAVLPAAACGKRTSTRDLREPGDSGPADAARPARGEQRFASATARLEPTGAASELTPISGTVLLRTTPSGVDLELDFNGGCFGALVAMPFPVEILDLGDCGQALQAPVWARGQGITAAHCSGAAGPGRLDYSRAADQPQSWTIGGAARSNVIGRALVVRDPSGGPPLACGVIARGAEIVRADPPPASEPPSIETRGHLAGACLLKTSAAPVPGCPDPEALVSCATEHCDLGGCLETCADYTACLDTKADKCAGAFECPASAECLKCQAEMVACSFGFCPTELSCPQPVTPDGPCSQLLACCALQGDKAGSCIDVVRISTALGGDPTCRGGMSDWDVLSHLPVPCKFVE